MESLPLHVHHPQVDGVHLQVLGDVVHLAFHGKDDLGDAVATHGGGRWQVGIGGGGATNLVWRVGIHLKKVGHGIGGDRVTVGSIGTAVGVDSQGTLGEMPVRCGTYRQFHVEFMACTGVDKGLLTAGDNGNRSSV